MQDQGLGAQEKKGMAGMEPAFPHGWTSDDGEDKVQTGLTKREWFAGLALQGVLSDPEMVDPVAAARHALQAADALLVLLSTQGGAA